MMRTTSSSAPLCAVVGAALCAALLLACGGDDDNGDTGADANGDAAADTGADANGDAGGDIGLDAEDDTGDAADSGSDTDGDAADAVEPQPNPDCDPLVALDCAMPWPSSLYLEADPGRATGYTLAFGATTLPANFRGIHIAPDDYRRMDGYGVSTPILTHFPNLDTSGLATDMDVLPSLGEEAPIRLYRVTESGMERVPYFAELDAWEDDPAQKVLFVRPAVILEEASRYVVAFLDGLRDTSGQAYAPSAAFAALVAGETDGDALLAPRQQRFDEVFALLEDAGVETSRLLLAWDFVTASSEAMHARMLEIRREGLAAAGEQGPEITITEWIDRTPEEDAHWASLVRGTIEVPHFMREDIGSDPSGDVVGWTFNEEHDGPGRVAQNGTRTAEFWMGIPHSATDGTPHGLMQHGHGFFGLGEDATGSWTAHGEICNAGNLIVFGGNWTGMAEPDFGNIQFAVFDLNYFRWLPDRMHQGMLEFILLARSMRERLATLPQITERGIAVDPDRLFFEGVSQGGIYGGVYMALTPDIQRGHLAVPGQNYMLLAHRSENFDEFFVALAGAYSGRARQAVVMATVQTLWDAIDPVSYWRHVAVEPFEDDAPREVLVTPSLGDYSVTELTMEILARTLRDALPIVGPVSDDIESIQLTSTVEYPHSGSGMVFYSWPGLRRQAAYNKPTARGDDDPHSDQRWLPGHQQQMIHFWDTGEIIDTCGGDGCTPD